MIGTNNVLAGVAQTTHNAQKVARQRDRRTRETADESQRLREAFEAQLRSVEEGEETESPTHLAVQNNMDDRESAEREETASDEGLIDRVAVDVLDVNAADTANEQGPIIETPESRQAKRLLNRLADDAQLYRHLDVTA